MHAAVAAVGKTELAVIVYVDEPKRFRFSDRWSDSITAQTVFNKLSGGDLELSIRIAPVIRQLDIHSIDHLAGR